MSTASGISTSPRSACTTRRLLLVLAFHVGDGANLPSVRRLHRAPDQLVAVERPCGSGTSSSTGLEFQSRQFPRRIRIRDPIDCDDWTTLLNSRRGHDERFEATAAIDNTVEPTLKRSSGKSVSGLT